MEIMLEKEHNFKYGFFILLINCFSRSETIGHLSFYAIHNHKANIINIKNLNTLEYFVL